MRRSYQLQNAEPSPRIKATEQQRNNTNPRQTSRQRQHKHSRGRKHDKFIYGNYIMTSARDTNWQSQHRRYIGTFPKHKVMAMYLNTLKYLTKENGNVDMFTDERRRFTVRVRPQNASESYDTEVSFVFGNPAGINFLAHLNMK
ncbi:hypothetical protein BJ508DRAFT_315364 [Ascobolus immersus RN42]|uniref:Uncharacterized protein n=1 Tax=Ascobolus immersus RN42 TaxID=1160509 RepID=A0A3N4HB84_ASCIM|nr:hypothetical protein BJ508DRAFT_315364 [Ascobolus immersus RN42]